MSGESETEKETRELFELHEELSNLRTELDESENNLEGCQDDLAEMTQMRDNLAEALQEAVEELEDLYDRIRTTDHRAVLSENS